MATAMMKGSNSRHVLNQNSGFALKEMFRQETANARTLDGVCGGTIKVVERLSLECGTVGFVSAVISSDGPKLIDRNMAVLAAYTDHIRKRTDFPVISATDVFHSELLNKYRTVKSEKWAGFWRSVIGSGVTDLFMTPRWNISVGARDEHEFAKHLEIRVHYFDVDPELLKIFISALRVEEQ